MAGIPVSFILGSGDKERTTAQLVADLHLAAAQEGVEMAFLVCIYAPDIASAPRTSHGTFFANVGIVAVAGVAATEDAADADPVGKLNQLVGDDYIPAAVVTGHGDESTLVPTFRGSILPFYDATGCEEWLEFLLAHFRNGAPGAVAPVLARESHRN